MQKPTPDELMNDALHALPRPRRLEPSTAREVHQTSVVLPPELGSALIDAAAARGMSVQAYARRAVTAFVAHDRGMDWYGINETEPPIATPGVRGGVRHEGRDFGNWVIRKLTS